MAWKFSKLFDFFKSKKKPEAKRTEKPKEKPEEKPEEKPVEKPKEDILRDEGISASKEESKTPIRTFNGGYNPQRKIILWGWDQNKNPSFLVLYGRHQFLSKNHNETRLEENVKYTDYAIFRGSKGHFPSFEAVEIVNRYDYKTRQSNKNMYYKKDSRQSNYYNPLDPEKGVKDYRIFEEEQILSFSYYEEQTQEDYVNAICAKNLSFPNFRLADTREEVLGLDNNISQYTTPFFTIMSNSNLYLRKKHLREILDSNPSKELYNYILKVGSNELISGLFLELGLSQNDILLPEAQNIINTNVDWIQGTYLDGLKRCASLYISSFDTELREKRIHFIQENFADMDLHIQKVRGNPIPKDKELIGSNYRNYAMNRDLSEYKYEYSYKEKKSIRTRTSAIYKVSHYSDGVILNSVNLKNTIQEAEIYGLPDVIGQIAYYMDAPRLVYYFRGNSKIKSLSYFRGYLRRIIDFYAVHNEDYFVKAMKRLCTSYTNADSLSKYPGHFQYNYFIKYYLYYEAPMQFTGNLINENHGMDLGNRHERNKEIWENHLEDVVDILIHAKIPVILKAFYLILKDSDRISSLTETLSYETLLLLSTSSYPPVAQMFVEIMNQKIESETTFNIHLMLAFMESSNKDIQDIAARHFIKTNGKFSVENLEQFLFLNNLEEWSEVLERSIEVLNEEEYLQFLYMIMNNIEKFSIQKIEFSEDLMEILSRSLHKLKGVSQSQISKLISLIIVKLVKLHEIPDFMFRFMEEVIFSNTFKEMHRMVQELAYEEDMGAISQKICRIISFLNAIKNQNIPLDSQIIEILELGSARMIKVLIGMLSECREQLHARFPTLLIMLESDVTALNEVAKEVFAALSNEKQKELHYIIIDSPDQKTYIYGLQKLYEIYEEPGACIPEEFMVRMLEHSSSEVKSYISNKVSEIIKNLGNGKKELFIYYVKTLLFLPNKVSAVKNNIYEILPIFVNQYREKQLEIEEILLDLGGSNIIVDSERALVALAKIKKEAV